MNIHSLAAAQRILKMLGISDRKFEEQLVAVDTKILYNILDRINEVDEQQEDYDTLLKENVELFEQVERLEEQLQEVKNSVSNLARVFTDVSDEMDFLEDLML